MFCPNCGARNSEADTHCQKCGFNMKDGAGAKFKGTMLMMNDAVGAPAGARPGAAQPSATPVRGTAVNPEQRQVTSAAPTAQSLAPDEARRMRAKLKGTMIGVAPPGVGTFKPSAGAAPAAGTEPQRPRQATPGPVSMGAAVNMGAATPGFGARGGATMIGTGIGSSGVMPKTAPAVPGPTVPGPTARGAMAPGPTVPGTADPSSFNVPVSYDAGPGTVRSQPGATGIPGSGPAVHGDQVSALGGTRVMSEFAASQPAYQAVNPLGGTMVAGTPNSRPTTDSMAQAQPEFGPSAGVRTGTPAMGIPALTQDTTLPTTTHQAAPLSYDSDLDHYVKPESKVMLVVLTILTGGLYLVYRKLAAKKYPR